MYKKTATLISAMLLISSVGFASPLNDYSAGKTAIDLTVRSNADINWVDGGASADLTGKSGNLDWSITTGLGNKWAIQFRQFNAESKIGLWDDAWKTKSQEVNVLYQLDKNVSAFVGSFRASNNNITTGLNTGTKSTAQFGLIGSTKIAENTALYGIIGLGSGIRNLEVGLSYEVARNLELNLSYRSLKVTGIPYGPGWGPNSEYTAKGLGYGLTYKF